MRYLVLISFFLLTACAAGGLRPSIMTSPTGYLQHFPVGQVTEAQMIQKAGPPTRYAEIQGHRAMVYEVGRGYGLRTFTYILDDGKVADVLYNDNGPYNGLTASTEQK